MTQPPYRDLHRIVQQFETQEEIGSITPYGNGHINLTFRARNIKPDSRDFLLQKINGHVFTDIPSLMNNQMLVTKHLRDTSSRVANDKDSLTVLNLISSNTGQSFICDETGDAWRLMEFVSGSCTHQTVNDPNLARQGAYAFGDFLTRLTSLDPGSIKETIPHFHHVGKRLDRLEAALEKNEFNRAQHTVRETEVIRSHRHRFLQLQEAIESRYIPQRIVHNDTKLNNVLFTESGQALCVIDLDTVMPGIIQYDISDLIRTAATTAAEDERSLDQVKLDIDLFRAIIEGFALSIHHFITVEERELITEAADLLPYIIGIRFLTDYLEGDHYFKTSYPNHNLDRSRCQLALTTSICEQRHLLTACVNRAFSSKVSL